MRNTVTDVNQPPAPLLKRRSFVVAMASALVLLPLLGLNILGCNRAAVADKAESEPVWSTKIVSDTEPGEPLIVSGTIYSPDGKQPMEGITLYVYQTDATGVYTTSGGDNRATRIHGVMRTKADGRYQFRTIKPGSYPNSRNPAHIHAYVSGPGYPEYWIDEYHFTDDPYLSADDRTRAAGNGSFSPILKLERGNDGILRAVRDIKIERCTNNCTGR
jgi:protocatechuate 3,4-dioxygenase beta subunit